MPSTLVTGANAFVAAHIIQELISQGHKVTGSVRRASSGDDILNEHPEWKDHLSFVQVKDYAEAGVWDDIFKRHDFDFVVHVAAPLLNDAENTDYDRDFIRPSVEGNVSLLNSAKKFSPNLKAVAITGSINAATIGTPEELARPLTNATWNSISPDEARKAANPYISYCSSKKEAELAVWRFVETEKPSFGITVFLPALIFGPPIQPVKSVKSLNFSVGLLYTLFDGSRKDAPRTMFPSYVDVRDLASAHVKALRTTQAHGHRYLINGARWTNTAGIEAIRRLVEKSELPESLLRRLPETPGEDVDVPVANIHAEEGNEVLGLAFRSLEETMRDTVRRVLELEEREGI